MSRVNTAVAVILGEDCSARAASASQNLRIRPNGQETYAEIESIAADARARASRCPDSPVSP